MTGLFTLKVMLEFSAAHALRGYVGDCARVHGHNWKVEAEIKARGLNDIGIALDFKDMRKAMKEIIDTLDHQFLNELPPFDRLNPTAENLAMWFFTQMKPIVQAEQQHLAAVRIWETDRCSVRYSEDD